MSQNTTTARKLGAFRVELIEEGFSAETAEQLALDAGRMLLSRGDELAVNA